MKETDVLCTVTFTVKDVELAFACKYGRLPSKGQLNDCVENIDKLQLKDSCTEAGLDVICSALI